VARPSVVGLDDVMPGPKRLLHSRAFLRCGTGDHEGVLWLAILTPTAAAAAVVCLVIALTGQHH
jgi:hypothetical protein